MLKLNNKGFVLVETLVTAVFVMAIFSIIYSNFYPIMAEYEKRENYDDVDSKYAAFWIKRIIQSDSVNFTSTMTDSINNQKYYQFSCDDVTASDYTTVNFCKNLVDSFEIAKDDTGKPKIYLTNYSIGNRSDMSDKNNFKGIVENNTSNKFTSSFQDYIMYLPTYSKVSSLNGACYRVIVEFHHTKNENDFWTYSTIEVIKGNERCW